MTELVWEGKYKDGKKVVPVRIALPFQTIETVNASAQERLRLLHRISRGALLPRRQVLSDRRRLDQRAKDDHRPGRAGVSESESIKIKKGGRYRAAPFLTSA